ncbi:snRNA-activating protein complex subunit 5-like [Lineus longissimus]|uniref:snRNA-activating protein complex subunit 5-like n=1 Tax=Lineus longissimus TaxID=88925 RepID=UPI002B4F62CD
MSFSELKELKEEEKVLTEIASKFNDQLNRLKVEELALINQLRSKREDEALSETTDDFLMDDEEKSINDDLAPVDLLEELDLAVHNDEGNEGEVEEEDEEKDDETANEGSDEEEYQDDLKALMQQINAHRSHYD